MEFTNEETESQKDGLAGVTELEEPRLGARPLPGSQPGTLYCASPPPAISDGSGFPARGPISEGTRHCPWSLSRDLLPAQTSIPGIGGGGVSEASRAVAPAQGPCPRPPGLGPRASVTLLLPAPVGIGNRKKQAGTAALCGQAGQLPLPPRAFLICFLEGEEGARRAKPMTEDRPGLGVGGWATELEIKGRDPSF